MPGATLASFMANSPVFTPSPILSPIFCKPSTSLPPTTPSSSAAHSPVRSPLSPLKVRFQKHYAYTLVDNKRNIISNNTNKGIIKCCSPSSASSDTTVLKRKRPAKIDIPLLPLSFEAMAGNQLIKERLDEVEADGEGYAVYSKRGKRRSDIEDRHSASAGSGEDSQQAIFSVFDGHGGSKAAEFAAKYLSVNIAKEVAKRNGERIQEAIREGYLTTDAECLKEDIDGGTCCVTAFIRQGNLFVSNAGDCRVVMSRGGVAEALTVDHRPSREEERERIEGLGGYVDCRNGVWRIQGTLAVSRGIGDRNFKDLGVIAEPDTRILEIEPDCEFLILGSDGLWDKVDNQEAVDVVRPLCITSDNSDKFASCKKLVNLSLERGTTDDVTVMIIELSHFICPSLSTGKQVV